MARVEMPAYIDDPVHILIWSADEAAPILIGLMLGVLIGQITLCVVTGILATKLYSKYRDARPDGYIMHLIYWYGFLPTKARSIPNPFARSFRS
jgi:conjugal transfer pilus assembly protein TraL